MDRINISKRSKWAQDSDSIERVGANQGDGVLTGRLMNVFSLPPSKGGTIIDTKHATRGALRGALWGGGR
jgi:hypothetical protein